jgi:Fur family zinc uptake transcriptional regulator
MSPHEHNHLDADLTKNQTLVIETLLAADGPLSAYSILDQLRDHGFRAPPQVYRALEKLVGFGMVHRLESINAFLACRNPSCAEHMTAAFTICDQCGKVAEFTDDKLTDYLETIAEKSNLMATKTTIEIRGICEGCQKA